jgi:hypothetical protein
LPNKHPALPYQASAKHSALFYSGRYDGSVHCSDGAACAVLARALWSWGLFRLVPDCCQNVFELRSKRTAVRGTVNVAVPGLQVIRGTVDVADCIGLSREQVKPHKRGVVVGQRTKGIIPNTTRRSRDTRRCCAVGRMPRHWHYSLPNTPASMRGWSPTRGPLIRQSRTTTKRAGPIGLSWMKWSCSLSAIMQAAECAPLSRIARCNRRTKSS